MSDTPLPSSFDGNSDFYEENRWQKFSRRLKEEPLIPLGCVLTCWALFGASRSIRAGDHNRTNRMFRARIYAQGFTLVAMVAGSMYWESDRNKRKEFEGVLAEQKAKEKNEAWIRELEARDREDKEFAAARDARRKGSKLARSEEDVKSTVAKTINSEVAKSMIDDSERRRGTLEMVAELIHGRK